jgi:beta-glucosidase/6-phospho-beta-glucosidase/beta-galactosidase
MFATGIENSYPTIDGGAFRVDEMDKCGHYDKWRIDFDCVQDLGVGVLRYGPPLHRAWRGPGRYDWGFADATFGELLRRDITPMADLCHFGVPDWLGNFQNPDFPHLFADYARAFAQRFRWVQLYTPSTRCSSARRSRATTAGGTSSCARTAASSRRSSTSSRPTCWRCRRSSRSCPNAIFIQSESSEYFHADSPDAIKPAEIANSKRFLSLDLNYGKRVDSEMYEYLADNGMTRDEYHFFLGNRVKQHCVMGNDYYVTNEHRVFADGSMTASGEVFGYDGITWQYYDRYRLPVMHTETNFCQGANGDEAVFWLWKEWAERPARPQRRRSRWSASPWYSLTDQVDWDSALREKNGRVNALGLYDLDRRIRPVGEAYKKIVSEWGGVLPTQSVSLRVPIFSPSEQEAALKHAMHEQQRPAAPGATTDTSNTEGGGPR